MTVTLLTVPFGGYFRLYLNSFATLNTVAFNAHYFATLKRGAMNFPSGVIVLRYDAEHLTTVRVYAA